MKTFRTLLNEIMSVNNSGSADAGTDSGGIANIISSDGKGSDGKGNVIPSKPNASPPTGKIRKAGIGWGLDAEQYSNLVAQAKASGIEFDESDPSNIMRAINQKKLKDLVQSSKELAKSFSTSIDFEGRDDRGLEDLDKAKADFAKHAESVTDKIHKTNSELMTNRWSKPGDFNKDNAEDYVGWDIKDTGEAQQRSNPSGGPDEPDDPNDEEQDENEEQDDNDVDPDNDFTPQQNQQYRRWRQDQLNPNQRPDKHSPRFPNDPTEGNPVETHPLDPGYTIPQNAKPVKPNYYHRDRVDPSQFVPWDDLNNDPNHQQPGYEMPKPKPPGYQIAPHWWSPLHGKPKPIDPNDPDLPFPGLPYVNPKPAPHKPIGPPHRPWWDYIRQFFNPYNGPGEATPGFSSPSGPTWPNYNQLPNRPRMPFYFGKNEGTIVKKTMKSFMEYISETS